MVCHDRRASRGVLSVLAAQNEAACYGLYADPRAFLEEARQIRKGMEGMPQNTPFDSPRQGCDPDARTGDQ
jgi:hypothetical protein